MNKPPLLAYHGNPAIKAKYIARVEAHRAADQLIRGIGWDKEAQRGCAVGCTLHSYNHSAYEYELGIPMVLAKLEDGIFESLPVDEAMSWPGRFLDAIPVGADLSLVWPKFAHWLLVDKEHGVVQFAMCDNTKSVIVLVAGLYERWIAGTKPEKSEWEAAYAASRATAAATAAAIYAIYEADAAADADAAAAYATNAATYAAYAYAYATASEAAIYDARKRARSQQAKKLIQILGSSPALA